MSEVTRSLVIQSLQILIQLAVVVLVPIAGKALMELRTHIQSQIGKTNYQQASIIVKDIVYAIEQQYPNMEGSEKYKTAIYTINERLGNLLTEKEINDLVEAAVAGINLATKGTIKPKVMEVKNIEAPTL